MPHFATCCLALYNYYLPKDSTTIVRIDLIYHSVIMAWNIPQLFNQKNLINSKFHRTEVRDYIIVPIGST